MRIGVRCHGVTARVLGAATFDLELPDSASIEQALAVLVERASDGDVTLARCACAVDDVLVPRAQMLVEGDVLELLPPVAGG